MGILFTSYSIYFSNSDCHLPFRHYENSEIVVDEQRNLTNLTPRGNLTQ